MPNLSVGMSSIGTPTSLGDTLNLAQLGLYGKRVGTSRCAKVC